MEPNLPPQTSAPTPEPSAAPEPQNVAPAPPLEHGTQVSPVARRVNLKFRWGLLLLILPSALCVAAWLLYGIVHIVLGWYETPQNSEALFGNSSVFRMVSDPLMIFVMHYVTLSILPLALIGTILIITRKK